MRRTKLTLRFAHADTRQVTAWLLDEDNGLRAHRTPTEKGDGKGWVISTRAGLRVIGYWWKRDDALAAVEALTGVIPFALIDTEFAAASGEVREQILAILRACCGPRVLTVEEVDAA